VRRYGFYDLTSTLRTGLVDEGGVGESAGDDLGGEVGPLAAGVEDDAVGGDDDGRQLTVFSCQLAAGWERRTVNCELTSQLGVGIQ
jgi:hypothetical protein